MQLTPQMLALLGLADIADEATVTAALGRLAAVGRPKTLLDQVEIRRDGVLQVRLVKAMVTGDVVTPIGYHRTMVEPGIDPEEQLASLNASLLKWPVEQGGPLAAVESAEWDCVRRTSLSEHTPEVVVAYHEKAALAAAASDGTGLSDLALREAALLRGRERAENLQRRTPQT